MPTYMLEGDGEVGLSPRPLTVSLRLDPPTAHARLEAVSARELVADVVRPRSDLMIIPTVRAAMVVRVVPVGVPRFPSPTTVHVSISVDGASTGDEERAVLIPLDLAGLDGRDLVVLEPGDRVVRVRAARVLPPPSDLGPVGNAARVAATEQLGVQYVDEDSAVDVIVMLDGSASFRPKVADGSAATVLSILEGVAQVISPGRDVVAGVRGLEDHLVTNQANQAARPVVDVLSGFVPTTGLRAATSRPYLGALGRPSITYIVTDSIPPDIDQFLSTDHLVMIGSRRVWQLFAPPAGTGTLVETGHPGTPIAAELLADPVALHALVASLLPTRPPAELPAAPLPTDGTRS